MLHTIAFCNRHCTAIKIIGEAERENKKHPYLVNHLNLKFLQKYSFTRLFENKIEGIKLNI